ncbi:hypothetical protein N7474_006909 [Penicillium riverlandense]|uniref:uncharacterized protein n=1 Tax=Penicillium riverlandense TaxID=1903569 RepID=UPI0025481B93|nr:uncharacterized protein N7474_006909 [Penicillium riverlandense]KAJ5815132.1 hypothetical protein N7474_006909 [Penicillium riverlandense]
MKTPNVQPQSTHQTNHRNGRPHIQNSKLFKRKYVVTPYYPRRTEPEAIGISDSTCKVNGDPVNEWKLPIPPLEQREVKISGHPCNPQHQSRFFKLPPEIRRLIYLELLGGRRVHIDYTFKWPSPFRPQPLAKKRKRYYWQWWHLLCHESDYFSNDPFFDRCAIHADEANDAKNHGWTVAPEGTKIRGVELLSSCQMALVAPSCPSYSSKISYKGRYREALPILYSTNVFDMGDVVDTPFHMSRLFPSEYTSQITAMGICIEIRKSHCKPPEITGNWVEVYPACYELFNHTFWNVRRLRVTMRLTPWDIPPITMNDQNLDAFIAPLEKLEMSREWIYLDLCVPDDWYP